MKLHAILLTLEDHPGDDGIHTRQDTIDGDIRAALQERGYEDVTIISHEVKG